MKRSIKGTVFFKTKQFSYHIDLCKNIDLSDNSASPWKRGQASCKVDRKSSEWEGLPLLAWLPEVNTGTTGRDEWGESRTQREAKGQDVCRALHNNRQQSHI